MLPNPAVKRDAALKRVAPYFLPWRKETVKTFTSAILMFAVAISNAFATAQYPDKVVYEGETYSVAGSSATG